MDRPVIKLVIASAAGMIAVALTAGAQNLTVVGNTQGLGNAAFDGDVTAGAAATNKLYVRGTIVQDNNTALSARNASGGSPEPWMVPRDANNTMTTNYGANGWSIRNNAASSVMYLTNGGNVGIGAFDPTRGPNAKLDVSGVGNMISSTWNYRQIARFGDGGQVTNSAIVFDTGATAGPTALRGFGIAKSTQDFAISRFDSNGVAAPTEDFKVSSAGVVSVPARAVFGGPSTGSTEPIEVRGPASGVAHQDRAVGNPRWVEYANAGAFRFFNDIYGERMVLSKEGNLSVNGNTTVAGTVSAASVSAASVSAASVSASNINVGNGIVATGDIWANGVHFRAAGAYQSPEYSIFWGEPDRTDTKTLGTYSYCALSKYQYDGPNLGRCEIMLSGSNWLLAIQKWGDGWITCRATCF